MYDTDTILAKLFALQRFGIKPGLERTLKLLDFLGNPHRQLKAVHVAGTNGKGTVCSLLASVFTEAGLKTGLYTSPHLVDFNERIRINGVKIPDEDLVKYTSMLRSQIDSGEFTFFEVTTALAFKFFADKKTDIAIIETGMGGRFDSTNVINPVLSIITQISKDHRKYLGNTIEEIAYEKAGIIKKGVPCVIGHNSRKADEVIKSKAAAMKSPVVFADDYSKGSIISMNPDLSMQVNILTKENNYENLALNLAGKHQLRNILTAVTSFELLKAGFNLNKEHLYNGFQNLKKNTGLRGRIELIRSEPPFVIDVSHNPPAIKRLVETLTLSGYNGIKWNIVFTAMADKDYKQMLKYLLPVCNTLILTTPQTERSASLNSMEQAALKIGFDSVIKFSEVEKAMEYALDARKPSLAAGSFYLIGEILSGLNK